MSHPGRELPPLHEILQRRAVRALRRRIRSDLLKELAREALRDERAFLSRGKGFSARYGEAAPRRPILTRVLERRLVEKVDALFRPKLRDVINASGVLLHTNLGRALLGEGAREELARVAEHPVALEIDLETGRRGNRNSAIDRWLGLLTGAEAGLAVNNGAGALWLIVHGLARGKRTVISRGEEVAIGGSFRMPQLLRSTGSRIVEVGTTNKTAVGDYAPHLREGDLVLKVHPSNYQVSGYTEEATLEQLAPLCREKGATLVYDAGSGCLQSLARHGLRGELTINEALTCGAQVVSFSGDKLLGGPQAGLIVGGRSELGRLAKHPMMRALRLDKLILATLEATLAEYGRPQSLPRLPLYEALRLSTAELRRRAKSLHAQIEPRMPPGWSCEVARGEGAVGGGAFAECPVKSVELRITGPGEGSGERLHSLLRRGRPAILTGITQGVVRVDLRTLREDDLPVLADRIIHLSREGEASS
jgi:L-seryl-tRNA(Ser) seleniumtransferase